MDFACGSLGGLSAAELPVPLASTTKLPAWLYGGEEEADNGFHLGIMTTSSMKWSCAAWQAKTMAEVSVLVKKKLKLKKAVLWAPHSRRNRE